MSAFADASKWNLGLNTIYIYQVYIYIYIYIYISDINIYMGLIWHRYSREAYIAFNLYIYIFIYIYVYHISNYLTCGSFSAQLTLSWGFSYHSVSVFRPSVQPSSRPSVRLIFKTYPLLQFWSDIFQINTCIKYDIITWLVLFLWQSDFFLGEFLK